MQNRMKVALAAGALVAAMIPGAVAADTPLDVLGCQVRTDRATEAHVIQLLKAKQAGQLDPQDDIIVGDGASGAVIGFATSSCMSAH